MSLLFFFQTRSQKQLTIKYSDRFQKELDWIFIFTEFRLDLIFYHRLCFFNWLEFEFLTGWMFDKRQNFYFFLHEIELD